MGAFSFSVKLRGAGDLKTETSLGQSTMTMPQSPSKSSENIKAQAELPWLATHHAQCHISMPGSNVPWLHQEKTMEAPYSVIIPQILCVRHFLLWLILISFSGNKPYPWVQLYSVSSASPFSKLLNLRMVLGIPEFVTSVRVRAVVGLL